MVNCGKRLKSLIKERRFKLEEFATLIDTPLSTLKGWFPRYDMTLENIRRCCEVLEIPLYEFFMSDEDKKNIMSHGGIEGLNPETIEIIEIIRRFPEEDKKKIYRVTINALKNLLEET
jgi:transcriptional regulator with XRE-family HTH domain